MEENEAFIQRTWVQLLIDSNYKEAAAIAIDTDIRLLWGQESFNGPDGLAFEIPTFAFSIVKQNESLRKIFEASIIPVASRFLSSEPRNPLSEFRVKLIEPEKDWQNITRNLIANTQNPNQGLVTEKIFLQKGEREPFKYNEMKFASRSEIRIAQELEARNVLFFPLPLAVRSETGNFYEDHREPDFVICLDGVWGILEVSYHKDRYEKDSEKDIWFKKSGILCVQHYTAERCFNSPKEVVDEFLSILSKYKK